MALPKPITTPTHISLIKTGDTVFHDGKIRTVGKGDIKHCPFMESTLFGDSYSLGMIPVPLVMPTGNTYE